MIENKIENEYSIDFYIKYDKPIEVAEFTKSLNSFSDEYRKFINDKYGSERPLEAKLHISKISEGSILTTLVEYSAPMLPFLGNLNTVYEFGKHLRNMFILVSGKDIEPSEQKEIDALKLDVKDIENLANILAPGTNKNNHIDINVNGDNNTINVLAVNDEQSNAMVNRLNKEKKLLQIPEKLIHYKKAFYWEQAKKNIKSKTGNFGVIDDLYTTRMSVVFENEIDKVAMLKTEENPFNKTFIVDVEVLTKNNIPKIYKILKLHETIDD